MMMNMVYFLNRVICCCDGSFDRHFLFIRQLLHFCILGGKMYVINLFVGDTVRS